MFQRNNLILTSKFFLRHTVRLFTGVVLSSFAAASYYRPLSDNQISISNSVLSNHCKETNDVASIAPFRSSSAYNSIEHDEVPILLSIARTISIGTTTLAIHLFMNTYGRYKITNISEDEYIHFLILVLGGNGRSKTKAGLLTVSNHRSLFDDPGVVSCLLPLWMGTQPKYNRWGICSQEYCFCDALPAVIKGYFGAGKVLPICRGAGIDQSLLKEFATLLARGEWCHIFPEGGVWQMYELGGRAHYRLTNKRPVSVLPREVLPLRVGKLKWGVGKLISHAPVRPRVVPFAHVGMDNLLPQHPFTGKTVLKKQLIGGEPLEVRIKVGKEIQFDDLIQEHEDKHGKLWTYSSTHDMLGEKNWNSSAEEKYLYHKITLRIEHALELLTKDVILSHKI